MQNILPLKKAGTMIVKDAINVDHEILGGTPVFKGTRIPIKVLFDHLEGSSLEEFLKGYPSVSREQAEAVIAWAAELVQAYIRLTKWFATSEQTTSQRIC